MERLRQAILDLVSEQVAMIGLEDLDDETQELVAAFNAAGPFPGYPEVGPISDEDIEEMMD